MEHFPALFALNGRQVLVVGGGVTAYRSARLLAEAGACVTVLAPLLSKEMAALTDEGSARHLAKIFATEDLAGQALVIAATGIDAVDADVSAAAQARGLPVNVIDAPEAQQLHHPHGRGHGWSAPCRRAPVRERFFVRPVASAVFSSNERLARERRPDALNRGQPDPAGRDAGTNYVAKGRSTAKSNKERNAARRATGSKPKEASVKFFEVRVPAINALFVAYEMGGALILTSLEDIPCLNVEAGQTLAAQEVIRRVRLLAAQPGNAAVPR